MNRRMGKRGFTLVELMLVVVIIAVLAGIVLPRLVGTKEKADIAAAKHQIKTFETLLYTYQLHVGSFPSTDDGLNALIEPPSDESEAKAWAGPYLTQRTLPKDPWGNPFVYVKEAQRGIDYDLYSWGPDKIEGTDDDIYSVSTEEE